MDLLLHNLQPFLPDGVMVLSSAFGDMLRRGDTSRLARWKCFKKLRAKGKKLLRFGWPDCVGQHWTAFWVDLQPDSRTPITDGNPTFHAMDSLRVGPNVMGYLRNGTIRPLSVGRYFEEIFQNLIEFLKAEPRKYPETSLFGGVPDLESWVPRTMDAGGRAPNARGA